MKKFAIKGLVVGLLFGFSITTAAKRTIARKGYSVMIASSSSDVCEIIEYNNLNLEGNDTYVKYLFH